MFSSSNKRNSDTSRQPWTHDRWTSIDDAPQGAAAGIKSDSSFYDSSWELRRGLEVAELSDVPTEWGMADLDREPANASKHSRST